MKIIISDTSAQLGIDSAKGVADYLKSVIAKNGYARIVVSTGASQLPMFENLIRSSVDWSKVEMFHLDEYVNLPETHPASFRKYLKERFVSRVPLMGAYFVDGTPEGIKALSAKLVEKEVDLGIIGIGENGHIAFNDPPADFDTRESYITVNLDSRCRAQQVGEGWFASAEEVPAQAVSMTPYRIMQCKKIISVVPYAVKADAVKKTLTCGVSPNVPATLMKTHPDWELYLDKESAGAVISFQSEQ